ncbi:nitrous oxide reductase accessory protein NosL [Bacillus sp. J33]|uniref:nitrous oxide reductase accessory protein NosL n=1 Tax=Bacillus sp. J33 TaxID=935836 RepID=UPI00047B98C0|nr:nitrous oxide reductase accessory protein NosL [Bacillus sp. J33]
MKLKQIIYMSCLTILLAACTSEAAKPVDIRQNEDSCDVCHMGIEEMDAAAQMILKNGKPVLFDDIGCMVEYFQKEKPEYEAAFVHDYQTKEWISFDASWFVHDQNIASPMSYGIAAFHSEEDALAFLEEHEGEAYSKDDLLNADLNSFKKPGMKHSH